MPQRDEISHHALGDEFLTFTGARLIHQDSYSLMHPHFIFSGFFLNLAESRIQHEMIEKALTLHVSRDRPLNTSSEIAQKFTAFESLRLVSQPIRTSWFR
jgi:hypothetical protein